MQYKDENGVNEPSRRRLLKVIGALALAGSCPVAHAQKTQSAPGTLSPDARNEKQPFYGEHQAGILTPQQAAMMLVAFDVLASDKADLERLFRLLTQRFAFLTQGGAAPETPNPRLTTVRYPIVTMATQAAELALALADNRPLPEITNVFSPTLVRRHSVSTPSLEASHHATSD